MRARRFNYVSSTEKEQSGRARRRDFEANRGVILDAANSAFTELGTAVSIGTIAERAGVGPATVYRHFPNRGALMAAVFELRLVAYSEAMEEAQKQPDPEQAFRDTIHAIVALQARDRSFRAILTAREANPLVDPDFVRFGSVFLGSLEAARSAGVVRDDVTNEDIMLFMIASEGVAGRTVSNSDTALRRLVDIALDGFCNTRSPLDGESLAFEGLLDVAGG